MLNVYEDFQQLIFNLPGIVFWKDLQGKYRGCNKGLLEFWNTSSLATVIGKTDYDLFPTKIACQLVENDKKVVKENKEFQFEECPTYRDGINYIYITNKKPLTDKDGKIFGILCTSSNITKQKKVETDLRAANERAETEHQLKLGKLALQVAHDIRSPLAALDMLLPTLAELPEQKRVLIRGAIGRISDIAYSLLNQYKQSTVIHSVREKILLSSLLLSVIAEKRLQFKQYHHIELACELSSDTYGLFAELNTIEFKRLLSNLINNAVEAIQSAKRTSGKVTVSLMKDITQSAIRIQDNGTGIPAGLIEKLGNIAISQGKDNGHGLGLLHAKQVLTALGGDLTIESQLNEGTTMTLSFPSTHVPAWFLPQLTLNPQQTIVVLDDDISIHHIWAERLKPYTDSIYDLASPEDLQTWLNEHQHLLQTSLFLSDYELIGKEQTGLDLIECYNLHAYGHAVLITSLYEDVSIQKRCEALNIKLIPKPLAGFIPIVSQAEQLSAYDAVLIDDDELVHELWKMEANLNDKIILHCYSPQEFMQQAPQLSQATPIYIDSDLKQAIKGQEFAKQLYEQGFDNLYLTTGYAPDDFPAMPWIKAILSKLPPW